MGVLPLVPFFASAGATDVGFVILKLVMLLVTPLFGVHVTVHVNSGWQSLLW